MPLHNGISSIIHASTVADVTAFTYKTVYAQAEFSPVINGVTVLMPAGTTIDILVRSISGTAGVFVIGDKADTTNGTLIL